MGAVASALHDEVPPQRAAIRRRICGKTSPAAAAEAQAATQVRLLELGCNRNEEGAVTNSAAAARSEITDSETPPPLEEEVLPSVKRRTVVVAAVPEDAHAAQVRRRRLCESLEVADRPSERHDAAEQCERPPA